jgi:hypothetical protein
MANVPLIDEGTGNGGGRVHDGRGATLTASPGDRLGSSFRRARRRRSRCKCEPQPLQLEWRGIPTRCLARSETPMSGFRVRSRRLRRRSRPGMTAWGATAEHFFLYLVDNIPIRFIFPSVLPHREGRSRSSRSRGGMRWTPEMRRHAVHGGRLSSGRTDLRQHCHWQGDGRPWMERPLDSVTDDQVKTRSA